MEAIILAGGLGTRLQGVYNAGPKCLAPVGGRPFLYYLLRELARQRVRRLVLSLGYQAEAVIAWCQSSGPWPFEWDYVVEDAPLGTGGAIRAALAHCQERRVLVLNGDSFFQLKLSDLLASPYPITLALKPMRDFDRYGTVRLEQGRVTAFEEKRPCREGLINAGVYSLDRDYFDAGGWPVRFSFEREVLETAAPSGRVGAQIHAGYFIDIGVPADYARAGEEIPHLDALLTAAEKLAQHQADFLLLDRDGVINILREGDYVRRLEDFVFMPGILQLFPTWSRRFKKILVMTNQRGVGKGLMRQDDLEHIHRYMCSEIEAAGGRIDAIFCCTALSDDDPCRKPNPGLFAQARQRFPELDPARCVLLGDSESDKIFADRCGIDFIEVR